MILLELFSERSNHILHSLQKGLPIKNRFRYSARRSWLNIKNTVVLTILTFQHIQCLYIKYVEVAWVLLSSGTQVQPQIILDPDYLLDYLSVSYDYEGSQVLFWNKFKLFAILQERTKPWTTFKVLINEYFINSRTTMGWSSLLWFSEVANRLKNRF